MTRCTGKTTALKDAPVDDDSTIKRFSRMRPLVQRAVDWKITRHIEKQWQQLGEADGRVVYEEGRPVTDLKAYRERMREKILALPEHEVLSIVEAYVESPECREESQILRAKRARRDDDENGHCQGR